MPAEARKGDSLLKKGCVALRNKQNLHIHTVYADGKDTPEEIVLEAIARGFDSIGFSEHVYSSFSDYPYQMTVAAMADYKAEVRALKEKYRNKIDIFCGLECEHFSQTPTENFDYLIGSVHYLDFDGEKRGFDRNLAVAVEYINSNFGGNSILFAKKYFETVARLPENKKIDIIGHFDLLTKNNEKGGFIDVASEEYLKLGKEAIHALKGKIPLFEVNTGAISRGYRTSPYPQPEFLKEFLACGFGAVISSDCHDKNHLDCFYEEAEELLRSSGFKSKWILTDGGFREVGI